MIKNKYPEMKSILDYCIYIKYYKQVTIWRDGQEINIFRYNVVCDESPKPKFIPHLLFIYHIIKIDKIDFALGCKVQMDGLYEDNYTRIRRAKIHNENVTECWKIEEIFRKCYIDHICNEKCQQIIGSDNIEMIDETAKMAHDWLGSNKIYISHFISSAKTLYQSPLITFEAKYIVKNSHLNKSKNIQHYTEDTEYIDKMKQQIQFVYI